MLIVKYYKLNDNENTVYQNGAGLTAIIREKFIERHIHQNRKTKSANLDINSKMLEKEQKIKSKKSRGK